MKKVTAWLKKTKDGYVHNHLQSGWVKGKKPVGHASWAGFEWKKEFGFLNCNSTFEKLG